jgi:hypothetical protein
MAESLKPTTSSIMNGDDVVDFLSIITYGCKLHTPYTVFEELRVVVFRFPKASKKTSKGR